LGESNMGHVENESLRDIWFSQKFTDLRRMLSSKERCDNQLCSKCDFDGFRDPIQNSERITRDDLGHDYTLKEKMVRHGLYKRNRKDESNGQRSLE